MKKDSNNNLVSSISFCVCFFILGSITLNANNYKKIFSEKVSIEGEGSLMAGYPLGTSGSTSYSSYMKHYYDNLTENFGMNYDSSCGYVALGMLLSYYDACFDENLINNTRDTTSNDTSTNLISRRNSPGVLHDDFDTTNFSTIYSSFPGANLYLTYCQIISSMSLHAKLITIGASLGYVNTGVVYGGFSTTITQRIGVLNYYLQNVACLSSSDYTIYSNSYNYTYYTPQYDYFISEIVDLIDNECPVLLAINNSQYGSIGHAVVAYDYAYNPTTGNYIFYCHPGVSHSGYTTHMTIDDMGYSLINNYMAVSFNYDANPDNNYIVINGDTLTAYQYNSSALNWQTL